ncbi:MAG: hypothetical protein DCC71_25090 [Proteobacteria bacterium]|nr:MAG: hypothetical protein DCC71_25090 [Pseudomonadota bacterium]
MSRAVNASELRVACNRLGSPRARRALVFAAALALLGAPGGCGERSAPAPARPARIIVFSMDTVRADHVTGWGDAQTTPRIAEIAAEGTRFARFYGASTFTIPSHMSIFTGLDPAEHGVFLWDTRLSPDVPTMAELLRGAGYATRAFHEGGFIAGRFGFDRGFERYEEFPRIAVVREALPQVLDWMRAQQGPYFLFLHSYAAHSPYGGYGRYVREHPERGLPRNDEIQKLRERYSADYVRAGGAVPPSVRTRCSLLNQFAEWREQALPCGSLYLPRSFPHSAFFDLDRRQLLRSYDARIALVDRAIGEIRDLLEERGEWEDTLLVVTSDHGEAFFEHAGLSQHGYVPYDSVLHVPLVVSYPRALRDGGRRVVEERAWHLDLLPTVLGFAGVPAPSGLRGVDLGPAMRGDAALPPDRALFPWVRKLVLGEAPVPPRRVALDGPLKWIEGHPHFGEPGPMLFDLAGDPGEQRNLCAGGRGADCERLRAAALAWERSLAPRRPVHQTTGQPMGEAEAPPSVEVSPEEEEKLRGLGYVE